jgi:transcriptional regulator with XRE-family HTH domain
MPTIRENINPALLTFSRERMGYDIPVIAKKVSVNEERWLKWEQGEEKPTTNQLINLADKLDRTPAFFYLEQVPDEEEPLSEFRTINNLPMESASPKLISAIREARRNREELFRLYDEMNLTQRRFRNIQSPDRNITDIAGEIREWLG